MSEIRLQTWRMANRVLGSDLAVKVQSLIAGQPVNKLGIQFQIDDSEVLRYNREVKPRSWKSIHVLKRDFLEQLRADNPGALGILRLYPNTEGWEANPQAAAEKHIQRIKDEAGPVLDLFDAVEDNNEYIFPEPHSSREQQVQADFYMMHFIEFCTQDLGKKPVVLNASTGNWSWDIVLLERMLLALREYGGYLGFHEYDWPTLWRAHEEGVAKGDGGMWQALRWKRAAKAIREFTAGWCPNFIITEAGLERQVLNLGHAGWRMAYEDFDQAVENYIRSWAWYYQQLDEDIHSVNIFLLGGVAPWSGWGFDIKGVTPLYEAIKTFPVATPPTPEPEPGPLEESDGGNGMRVIDIDRNILTGEAAQALIDFHGYSFEYPYAKLRDGDHYYELVELEEKEGPAAFIFTVLDLNGKPVTGAETAWRWTQFPQDADDIKGNKYATDWYETADIGPTKEDGKAGPGMSKDWYTGANEPGPGQAWIRHPSMWAILVKGIGMIAGTNHRTLNGTWQEKIYTGGGPTPTPTPTPGEAGAVASLLAAANRLDQLGEEVKAGLTQASAEIRAAAGSFQEADAVAESLGELAAKLKGLL